jgi:uncharacterized membrane protein YuzA (DUF378 family)
MKLMAFHDFTDPLYLQKWLFKMAMVLLIVGGLNWFFIGAFGLDFVKAIFGSGFIGRLVYVLVGLSAVAVMFDRDTYLPFLGPTVAPCAGLENRVPSGATREVRVTIEPNTKVLYWASEPSTKALEQLPTWKEAYDKYENVGVATSDANGVVLMKVREPQPYSVPWKGRLEPHVHYRVCRGDGFMERIKTVFIKDGHVEGFQSGAGLLFSN